jgi:hypothetical protein
MIRVHTTKVLHKKTQVCYNGSIGRLAQFSLLR